MSLLNFQTLGVYHHEEYGRPSTERSLSGEQPSEAPDRSTSLTIRLKSDRETRVRLATGEKLQEMQGFLTLRPADELRPIASADKSKNQIGYLLYSEAYSSDSIQLSARYSFDVLLPRAQLNDLASLFRGSIIPLSIMVDVEGLDLPDEFSCTWDNKTKKHLPVVSVSFSTTTAQFPAIDLDDKDQVNALSPVTSAEIRTAVSSATLLIQKMNTRLTWAIMLLAAIAILTLFRAL